MQSWYKHVTDAAYEFLFDDLIHCVQAGLFLCKIFGAKNNALPECSAIVCFVYQPDGLVW